MPGLVPGIHVFSSQGSNSKDVVMNPAMTTECIRCVSTDTFAARQLVAAFADLPSSLAANNAISARLMAACRVGELICAPIRSVT
jgi:hypothetical protein